MDRLSGIGLLLGFGALVGTQVLDGGHIGALLQGPAAIIVLVGTLGATCLSCSERNFAALKGTWPLIFNLNEDRRALLPSRFRTLASVARKDGLVSLDRSCPSLPTPFMRRAVRHVIDGSDEHQLQEILTSDLEARRKQMLSAARVFEIAGGYAPTMGILGAVLGLIRAMESLSDPEALGSGIAIAFVATIYGVGLANLLLLPIATKIRQRCQQQRDEDLMIVEGCLSLQAGVSPRTLERILEAHLVAEATE